MARKRKKLKDLEYNSKEYWEKLLTQDGLSMERGRNERLIYVGNTPVLDLIQEENEAPAGRITPKPQAD